MSIKHPSISADNVLNEVWRKPCFGPVDISDQFYKYRGFIQNISGQGMFIETNHRVFDLGQEIRLRFSPPNGDNSLEIPAKVAEITETGIDVSFDRLDVTQQVKIEKLLTTIDYLFGAQSAFICPWAMVVS